MLRFYQLYRDVIILDKLSYQRKNIFLIWTNSSCDQRVQPNRLSPDV